MASGFRVQGGTNITDTQATVSHFVECADEDDLATYVTAQQDEFTALPYSGFTAQENPDTAEQHCYDLQIYYGDPPTATAGGNKPRVGEASFRFSFQMPGGHFRTSLQTMLATGKKGGIDATIGDHDQAINVNMEGDIEGINISPPAENFVLRYRNTGIIITGAYLDTVLGLCGNVNSSTFRGYPAGSIILVRVNGGVDLSGIWDLEFGFGYEPNRTSIGIGGLTISAKDGWDTEWVWYEKEPGGKPKAAAAYVERIYYRSNLNLLNLP